VRKNPQQTRQEKQSALLLAKQKEFKEAALAAKKRGDIAEARELLRQAKGFDTLLQATDSGLPVDLATLPVLPSVSASLDDSYEYVTPGDCLPGESDEIFQKLDEDLKKQLKVIVVLQNI
jgi:coiled-coil and C2 domain-containing protein 1